jgi:hypothetical protein
MAQPRNGAALLWAVDGGRKRLTVDRQAGPWLLSLKLAAQTPAEQRQPPSADSIVINDASALPTQRSP